MVNKTTYRGTSSKTTFKGGGGGPSGPTPAEIQKEKYLAALRAREGTAMAGTNQKARKGRKSMTRGGYGIYIPGTA